MRHHVSLVLIALTGFVGCVPPRSSSHVVMTTRITTKPSDPFQMPLSGNVRLLSAFGERGRRPHTGVDLRSGSGNGAGQPVLAARAGRVMSVGWIRGYGQQVTIEHADGYKTRYAHMKSVNVDLGQRVELGHSIGRVGATGRASAPHLHFEVITPKGAFIDPLLLLPTDHLSKKK